MELFLYIGIVSVFFDFTYIILDHNCFLLDTRNDCRYCDRIYNGVIVDCSDFDVFV